MASDSDANDSVQDSNSPILGPDGRPITRAALSRQPVDTEAPITPTTGVAAIQRSVWDWVTLAAVFIIAPLFGWWLDVSSLTRANPALAWLLGSALVSVCLLALASTHWIRSSVARHPILTLVVLLSPIAIGSAKWASFSAAGQPDVFENTGLSADVRHQNEDGTLDMYVRNDGSLASVIKRVIICDSHEWQIVMRDRENDDSVVILRNPATSAEFMEFVKGLNSNPQPPYLSCLGSQKSLRIVSSSRLDVPPNGGAAELRVGPYWGGRLSGSEAIVREGADLCPIQIEADNGVATTVQRCDEGALP